jgi:hypothetical protein
MAQRMVELRKKLAPTKMKTIATQTGDTIEFYGVISKGKNVHFRWSERIKDYVVVLTFSNLKKYIMIRDEWKKFRKYIIQIDHVFNR